MESVQEITVLVTVSYEELHHILTEKGFTIASEFQLNDIYMISDSASILDESRLDLLNKCVLVREVMDSSGVDSKLLYKYKEYDENGDIIKQGKTWCSVLDVHQAYQFMKSIGYHELMRIYDHSIVYQNGKIELAVQLVNDKYVMIEFENDDLDIEEMKRLLDSFDLPYQKENYFVKKALMVLEDTLKQG